MISYLFVEPRVQPVRLPLELVPLALGQLDALLEVFKVLVDGLALAQHLWGWEKAKNQDMAIPKTLPLQLYAIWGGPTELCPGKRQTETALLLVLSRFLNTENRVSRFI